MKSVTRVKRSGRTELVNSTADRRKVWIIEDYFGQIVVFKMSIRHFLVLCYSAQINIM